MSTPKNRQQNPVALSTVKKGPQKGLKNVLMQPQDIFWPILKEEKEKNELHSTLTELLPLKECIPKELSWAKLCKLSKEERSALKKETQAKLSKENSNNVMTTVILGINGVTKALEKNNLCSILVDSNVEPLFLIKHIVVMGQNKNIPVLLIPFLKTVTLKKIGFACAALGIKKFVSQIESEHFYKLHQKISTLTNNFPKTKVSHQLFNTDDDEMDLESTVEEESSSTNANDKINEAVQKTFISKCVYKYRSSSNERAFIPPNSEPVSVEVVKPWTEFITLGGGDDDGGSPELNETIRMVNRTGRYMDIHESDHNNPSKSKNKVNNSKSETVKNVNPKSNASNKTNLKNTGSTTYIPLKVKRIQGNPKRLKATKIAKSKKKVIMKK